MEFKIGHRVRMQRTDNYGVVTAILPGGLVEVRLDGGKGELPLPVDILEKAEAPAAKEGKRPRVKKEAAPPPKAIPTPAIKSTPAAEADERNRGVRLAFDPMTDNEANPVAYEVYLLNGTPHKIIYELKMMTHSNRRWSKSGTLDGYGKKRLDAVEYRWLNEKLNCELDVRTILTGGTGPRNFQRINLKGQQFFSKLQDVPELYGDAHLYMVFPTLSATPSAPAAAPNVPSLKAITQVAVQQKFREKQAKAQANKRKIETNLSEKLAFEESIDLHIEKLVDEPEKVARHEVLPLQLKHYDEYMDQALRMGVDRVFIIHGVGNGVLKRAIHSRLHHYPFVRDFVNEHHPKYGYGATEVIFD